MKPRGTSMCGRFQGCWGPLWPGQSEAGVSSRRRSDPSGPPRHWSETFGDKVKCLMF